jgi:hypothetical protein
MLQLHTGHCSCCAEVPPCSAVPLLLPSQPVNQPARLLPLLTAASTTRRTGATGDATKALLRELNALCA